MALKIEITIQCSDLVLSTINMENGVNTVYARIEPLIAGKEINSMNVNFYKYDNNIIGDQIDFLSRQYKFPSDLESNVNTWIQGYEYLKTLPEFEGSIDC